MKNDKRIAELKAEIKAIKEEYEKAVEENKTILFTYYEMEGMYGKKAYSPWDCGQGLRGYHYEYSSKEIEMKEEEERKAFLENSGYRRETELYDEMIKKVLPLEEELSILKYGKTVEEREIERKIKYKEKKIIEYKSEIERYEREIEELNKKREEMKRCE